MLCIKYNRYVRSIQNNSTLQIKICSNSINENFGIW